MSIAGNLETMDLVELLQWLSSGAKTGALRISDGRVEKRIFFDRGRVVATQSSASRERLGQQLVQHDLITETELAKAMEMHQARGVPLGEILVTLQIVTPEELERILRLQTEEIIYELFEWSHGEFGFHDGERPLHETTPVSIQVEALILKGVQRIDSWKRIRRVIPTAAVIPVQIGEWAPPRDDRAAAVLRLVDDDRSLPEIVLEAHSTDYLVSLALSEQVEAGRLKVVRMRSPPNPSVLESIDDTSRDLIGRGVDLLENGDLAVALAYVRAAARLGPRRERLRAAAVQAEREIARQLDEAGLDDDAIPKLTTNGEGKMPDDLTPEEGYIVSRINGRYDLKTIMRISPISALEARLVVWRLLRCGAIELDAGDKTTAAAKSRIS